MIAYLGVNKEAFEYETVEQLRTKCLEYYNIYIGNGVRIGNRVNIGRNVTIGDGVGIGDDVSIGHDVTIRHDVTIGRNVTIGDDVTIRHDVTIGRNVTIGDDVNIGDGVSILVRAKIPSGIKINKIYHLMNEYKYHVSGYGNHIQMGCFTRTIEEWGKNFWNNDEEFPEDSEAGQLRLKAYKKMKKLLEMEIEP